MRQASSKYGLTRWLGRATAVCVLAATPQLAFAQNASEKAAAEALFDEGLKLLKDDKLEEACARFEKSHGIDPAIGTLLYLAECYERTGRTASAWATFREAASGASAAGQSDRAAIGAERARKLEAKLSRLTLNVGGNAAIVGFKVERDEQTVPAAVYGEPVPVDPGEHKLVATAPGYEPWRVSVMIEPGGGSQAVSIPPLNPLPAPLPEPTAAPVAAPPPQPPPQRDSAPPASREPDLTWAWVSGGVGLAGIGLGVYFGLEAADLDEQANEHCDGNACFDREGPRLSSDARDAALIANIGYGVGAIGLGTAVVLAVIALQDDEPLATDTGFVVPGGFGVPSVGGLPRVSVVPNVDRETAGVQMRGQF